MTDRLASLFESAVSMLPMSEARSLDLFTEITNYDESACDAWIGRIRCGDTDRVTLFRAWYSRRNFGQLSGSVQISMSTLNARIAIGGLYGDITYPVTSPLAITMGFAACEAAQGNYADAMEALEAAPVAGSEHLVAWMKAVVYGAAERWTDVIDQVKSAGLDGGKFVALQSPDPRYTESMYYIDPQGVRYGVPNAETAKSLGLSSPQNAPWEIVRLLVDGPVLSKDAALLEHDTLPADPSPRKVPAGASGAP